MKITNEVKIGAAAVAGIVLLFFGLQFLKGISMFSSDSSYPVAFTNVSGLDAATAVYANGYKVGSVQRIDYDFNHPERIVAVIGVDKNLRLPRGTHAEIATDLLGSVQLQLVLGPNPVDLMATGDTIAGNIQEGLMGKAAQMLPQLETMLPKLDSILGSVNRLLADTALVRALHNVDQITANLTATTAQLNRLTVALNGSVPAILNKTDATLANAQQLTGQLAGLDIAGTMQKVDATMAHMEQMTARLNDGKGTLGLMMNDETLYRRLDTTVNDADSLLNDLRKHPKRYVHFSIFGRKDK